ncbi:OmpA family protein [Pseudomonas entomophila]|uniref:OmpA family protein n=1 Tax=Pseudomonas entomophila TaxID=312306 RepID=UPI001F01029E|nr:OmpA family protein [Pseudomonas entomophila]MCG8295621.1 OmpA family protein [Pseudomonas entomophila]
MSKRYLLPAMSVLALVIAGCAATPENPRLVEAREAFSTLQAKPESHRIAALETQQAQAALGKAEEASLASRKSPEVEQLAYLANRKIETAEETIRLRQAEAGMRGIDARRAEARLEVRTAQLNALKALNGKETERGTVVSFGDVLFATGKATLRNESLDDIRRVAQFLLANPERKVRVEGFTDARGSESLNQVLSEDRAQAVAEKLEHFGVSRNRITSMGYGKSFLLTHRTDERSLQRNRRVEVIISQGSEAVRAR